VQRNHHTLGLYLSGLFRLGFGAGHLVKGDSADYDGPYDYELDVGRYSEQATAVAEKTYQQCSGYSSGHGASSTGETCAAN